MPRKFLRPAALTIRKPALFGALVGCGLGLGSVGCSGSSAERRPGRITDDAGLTQQDDGAMPAPGVIDGDAGTDHALGAAILADKVELCAGECTNLKVTARTPHAPLTYAWTHELGDAAEARVCPEETTTYQVKVSEVVEPRGEFTPDARTDEAQLTVGVRTCEPDNPVLCEFRYRHEFLLHGNLFNFDKPWIFQVGGTETSLAASGTGVVVTGAFGKRLDLGAGAISGSANMNGFVHKLDADCKPEWTRAMGASIPTDVLIPLGIASDTKGNVYAASAGGPLLNFDPFAQGWATFATEIVVHKFSAKGEQLLRVSLPVPLGGVVMDIEVDASERIYLTGLTNSWTDFGGGPLGLSPTTMTTFFVALDAAGKHRRSWGNAQTLGMSMAGERVMSRVGGLGEIDFATFLLGVPPVTSQDMRLRQLRQDTLQEAFTLPPFSQFDYPLVFGGFPSGASAAVLRGYVPDESLEHLDVARFSSTGEATGRTDIFRSHDGLPDPELDAGVDEIFENLAVPHVARMQTRADGSFAMTGQYYTPTRLGTFLLDAPPAPEPTPDTPYVFPEAQAFVARISAQDQVLWARKLDWGIGAGITGLTITPQDGATWVAGRGTGSASANDGAATQQDLVVAKLRAEP